MKSCSESGRTATPPRRWAGAFFFLPFPFLGFLSVDLIAVAGDKIAEVVRLQSVRSSLKGGRSVQITSALEELPFFSLFFPFPLPISPA